MTMNKKFAVAAAVAALFSLPLAGHAQQSPGTLINDTAITAKIKAAQAADSTVRATQIDVETDANGVVTLSGTARSQAEIDRAMQIARGVDGVRSVNNNMKLAADANRNGSTAGSTARSTTGTTGTTGTTTSDTATAGTSRNDSTMRTSRNDATMRAPRSDRN